MDVFEGSNDVWGMLKVGDVLRVEAEKDEYTTEGQLDGAPPWKANEAILISKAKTDASSATVSLKMRKELEVCECVRACVVCVFIFYVCMMCHSHT